MRLLGHRVATLQHVPGQLAVGLCVEHGHHDVAAQEPDRVLHAALLVARVRVAEPGLQPVMLHEQFEHVHDGDLVPRDPMAGAGGVVKHQRQGDRAYVLEHRATRSPPTTACAMPKSTCASPGCHLSSRYPSDGRRCSSRHRFTYRCTGEYEPS